MNDLYQKELRLWMNLYQPSVRLVETVRIGSRLKRRYDKPATPLDRLIRSEKADPAKVAQLLTLRTRLDPFKLSETVNRKLEGIWRLSSGRLEPAEAPNPTGTEELSAVQRETLKELSKVFGIKALVKNTEGEFIHVNNP